MSEQIDRVRESCGKAFKSFELTFTYKHQRQNILLEYKVSHVVSKKLSPFFKGVLVLEGEASKYLI